ncbi:DNA polymerase I [Archaeoglobales archaeon]|nr:MAG: DNA polymerase I [Archaeoglobales archaeon]
MWIFDVYSKGNSVHLWSRKGDKVKRKEAKCPRSFYLYLPHPSLYSEMIESLETRYWVEECCFRTIYGSLNGYRVYAGRKVAEQIERQTKLSAKLYNVDTRLEQRFLAEKELFACGYVREGYASRFNPDFDVPAVVLDVDAKLSKGLGLIKEFIVKFTVDGDKKEQRLTSPTEKGLLSDLFSLIEEINPDLILLSMADVLMEEIIKKSKEYSLNNPISRTGRFRKLASKSYWSYGRVRYREKAMLPEGRVLIDKKCFNFREGGLKGILIASRLTGLSPNLTARFTPGTLISSYEVYEALRQKIAVPFRKSDAETQKSFRQLKKVDRGGMIFQPEPGFYENVYQLDFTSMYPSIIVKYNLSPETVSHQGLNDSDHSHSLPSNSKTGFLSSALKPLLELRIKTKKLKKMNTEYEGIDSILKWLLVTCFGYTGYRNAKFGRIEVHEAINKNAREILLKTKEIAEDMGFEIIHGIVDCLWLRNCEADSKIHDLKREVEKKTGLLTELDFYNWIVFLPMSDGFGAYNRYYGRLSDGEMKLRGIAARRRDTPSYIRKMQLEIFDILSKAKNRDEIARLKDKIEGIYLKYKENLRYTDLEELVIRKVIGKSTYTRRCPEASLLNYCKRKSIEIQPGLEVGYIVLDLRKWIVIPEWEVGRNSDVLETPDFKYYEKMLEKAWSEIFHVFSTEYLAKFKKAHLKRKI